MLFIKTQGPQVRFAFSSLNLVQEFSVPDYLGDRSRIFGHEISSRQKPFSNPILDCFIIITDTWKLAVLAEEYSALLQQQNNDGRAGRSAHTGFQLFVIGLAISDYCLRRFEVLLGSLSLSGGC
jgi:hypothetical protein